MSVFFSKTERFLLHRLQKKNLHSHVVSYVRSRVSFFPTLYLLSFGISSSNKLNDLSCASFFADLAITLYPQNSMGYIEKSKLFLEQNDLYNAEVTLLKAPTSKKTKKLLSKIRSYSQGATQPSEQIDTFHSHSPSTPPFPFHKSKLIQSSILHFEEKTPSISIRNLIDLASKTTRHFPLHFSGYLAKAKALSLLERWPEALSVLEAAPDIVSKHIDYILLLYTLYRKQGLDNDAFKLLSFSQKHHPSNHKILLRLANLYIDDGNLDPAYIHIKLAESIRPNYGSIRRLSFETDHLLLKNGSATLERILKIKPSLALKYLPMINRVSGFYPEHENGIATLRSEIRNQLWKDYLKNNDNFNKSINLAINNRWLNDAMEFKNRGCAKGLIVKKEIESRLNNTRIELGALSDLIEIAWKNEHSSTPMALIGGQPTILRDGKSYSTKLVEFFIPTAFFAKPEDEKETYTTVRSTFRSIAVALLENKDVSIIPRHQLNWRNCFPKFAQRVVSYHTYGENDPRHLRIQESTFSGFCSFDNRGFAGFSSIATDHERIERLTRDVSQENLNENLDWIRQRFVKGNVSKYRQTNDSFDIPQKYVFVALQIPTDIVSNLAYFSGIDLIRRVAQKYSGSDTKVVVKRHPYCGSMSVESTLQDLLKEGLVISTKASIHTIISNAEAIFTVNSGVGLESLFHLKPVVTCGLSDYSYAAINAKSEEELDKIIDSTITADTDRILRFLWFYTKHYILDSKNQSAIKDKVNHWIKQTTTAAI